MKRRIYGLLAAVCLILVVAPAVRAADIVNYAVTGGNIQFDKSTGTVTDCDKSVTSANIPAQIDNKLVTSIGGSAFADCDRLASVSIPASVTSVDISAFYDSANLTSITVDSSNTSYSSNDGVLFNKDATSLYSCPRGKSGSYSIPSSVTSVGGYAFYHCHNLTEVTIPSSMTSIGFAGLYDCDSLTNVSIPASVTSIGEAAFSQCSSLSNITVAESNSSYADQNGVLFNKAITDLHTFPSGRSGTYSIPTSVTAVLSYAFDGSYSVTNVDIPDSVTTIGNQAFRDCYDLLNVSIPNSVTSIGFFSFQSCRSLTSVNIPNSVTFIGAGAFSECFGLMDITVVENNPSYSSKDGVLFNKAATFLHSYPAGKGGSYAIPASVTSIGEQAFRGCHSLTSVSIPGSVTSISSAFWGCGGLRDVYYDGTRAEYGEKLSTNVQKSDNENYLNANFHFKDGTTSNPVSSLPNTAARDNTTIRGITFLILFALTLTVWALGRKKRKDEST